MKKFSFLVVLLSMLTSSYSVARDDIGNYLINDAISTDQAKLKLGTNVSFYFGEEDYGKVVKSFGVFKTNKKTNAFGKSNEDACHWVFLSAMISLRNRALKEGGNAVVDIKSNYKNNLVSDSDSFQCGAGAVIAGVALSGRVVTLEDGNN